MANGPSSSPSLGGTDKLTAINETHETRKGELSMGTKAALLSVALSVAAFINPLSSKSAGAATLTPGIAGPKVPGNDLLKSIALNNGTSYDTPFDSSTLSPKLQLSLRELSEKLRTGQRDGILSIELLEDPKLRTGIKGFEELGKRILNADKKTITLGSVESLTGFNLDAVLADMRVNLGNKTSQELQTTLTGQFINKLFEPIIANDKSFESPKRRTFNNFSNKGWTSKAYMDGQGAIKANIDLFEKQVRSLEGKGLLSPDMLFYAWVDAGGIAFQSSLKYKEIDGKPEFTGDKGVNPDDIDTGKGYWIEGRKNYADSVANYQLVTDPSSKVLVYSYRVTSLGGNTQNVQLLVPITDQELGRQAIQYGLMAPKRGELTVFLDTAGSEKEVEDSKKRVVASKERGAEHMKSIEETIRQFIAIANGKLSVEELKSKLPGWIEARNDYAKVSGTNPKLLAELDLTLVKIDPNAKKKFIQ